MFGDRRVLGVARLQQRRVDHGRPLTLAPARAHPLRHIRTEEKEIQHVVDDGQDLYAVNGVRENLCGHLKPSGVGLRVGSVVTGPARR